MTTRSTKTRAPLLAGAGLALVLAAGLPAVAQILGPAPAPGSASGQTLSGEPLETLRRMGLTPVSPLSREEEHLEVEAQAPDGRRLSVSFDLSGRLWEIEDERHDKDGVPEWRDLDAEAVRRFVTEAGFGFGRVLEEKKRHVVVRATTRDGANVVLHMDRNGYIYKQIWLRG